jgi:rod shape-determining protein MreD
MTLSLIENSLRWIIVMGLQILVFNNIYLGGVINPFIYVLIILSLPIEITAVLTLFVGFFTGFILDVFSHTYGMHTMALTFMGFLRPMVLKLVAPRDGYAFGASANVIEMGIGRYSTYAGILIFAHQLVLFLAEGFSILPTWTIILKVVVNTILTFVIILIAQSFVRKKD